MMLFLPHYSKKHLPYLCLFLLPERFVSDHTHASVSLSLPRPSFHCAASSSHRISLLLGVSHGGSSAPVQVVLGDMN